MPKITTFLTYDNQAEEAVRFYTSIFPHSKVERVTRWPEDGPMAGDRRIPAGTVLVIDFTLDGEHYVALNGGPQFKFSEGVSLAVDCKNQEEIDRYWEALSAGGGQKGDCGWLKDKFGVSWQVYSKKVIDMIADPDPQRSNRALESMMTMKKLVIADMERAVEGVGSRH